MSTGNGQSPDAAPTGTLPPHVPTTHGAPSTPVEPASPPVVARQQPISADALRARRERLAAEVAHLQWDLGGLAYEMAVRDHFRLDVLVRAAARMQQADAELAETDRILHLRDNAAAGSCRECGALHARAASFCWSCGSELMPRAEVTA